MQAMALGNLNKDCTAEHLCTEIVKESKTAVVPLVVPRMY
jgi:hypothetical protein